jgi:hypothetical protein
MMSRTLPSASASSWLQDFRVILQSGTTNRRMRPRAISRRDLRMGRICPIHRGSRAVGDPG